MIEVILTILGSVIAFALPLLGDFIGDKKGRQKRRDNEEFDKALAGGDIERLSQLLSNRADGLHEGDKANSNSR